MDKFRVVQIIHWLVYAAVFWLIYVAASAIFRQRLGRVARGAISLAVCSMIFVLIEAVLASLPTKGLVFVWTVGAAGNFYIYVLFMLIAVSAFAVLLLKYLLEKRLN